MTEEYNRSEKAESDDEDAKIFDEKNFLCGIFSWRPKWLQMFAKPMYFAFANLFFAVFQGAMKTGLNSSMTTLERKFGMSGQMVSVIMIMDNITSTLGTLFVGYYATKVSRPRILVTGVWLSVAACVFFVLPHIFYGHIEISGKTMTSANQKGSTMFTQFCLSNQTENPQTSTLKERSSHLLSVTYPVLVLLSIGNMCNGIGGTAFSIAGTTYTDDNVKKTNAPLYFGALLSLRMVGPLFGVIVNSYFLTVYEHPGNAPEGITTRDPRWIGAWWLPFVIYGAMMMLISIPLILFPRQMRRQAPSVARNKSAHLNEKPTSIKQKAKQDLHDFSKAIKRLYKNRFFFWKVICWIFILNGLCGYFLNLPKYIEIQYRVSAAKASFLTGSTKILAMIVATFFGGLLLRIFKPSPRFICLCSAFADLLNVAVLVSAIFLTCDNWKLAGTHLTNDGMLSTTNNCNTECSCQTKFEPFCDLSSNMSYASPCFGGCFGTNLTDMHCKCLQPAAVTSQVSRLWEGATQFASGFCRNDCSNLVVFLVMTTLTKFISSLTKVGQSLIAIRCVEPADKAMALAVAHLCFNIFAFIPYPLYYGALFDSTCLLWGERDGERSNCWYYDNDLLRQRYLLVTTGFYVVGIALMTLLSYFAKDIKDMYTEDDDVPMKSEQRKPLTSKSAENKEAFDMKNIGPT